MLDEAIQLIEHKINFCEAMTNIDDGSQVYKDLTKERRILNYILDKLKREKVNDVEHN